MFTRLQPFHLHIILWEKVEWEMIVLTRFYHQFYCDLIYASLLAKGTTPGSSFVLYLYHYKMPMPEIGGNLGFNVRRCRCAHPLLFGEEDSIRNPALQRDNGEKMGTQKIGFPSLFLEVEEPLDL